MKRKPTFTHIPDWLGVYHPGKITINNPEFHYYISRSELDQPVTLYLQQEDHAPCKQMKMYYTIEQQSNYHQGKSKDESTLKDFGYLQQLEEDEINKITVNKESVTKQSWIRKYEPRRFIDLLTDELHNRNVLTWLKSWDSIVFKKNHKIDTVPSLFKKNGTKSNFNSFYNQEYNYKKLILLAGPPGCGKTTLARVIAKHCGYHWEEINASDDRSGKTLISKIDNLVSNQTIRVQKKPICVIIDEVDGALDSDSNGIKEVLNYLESGVVANDAPKREKTEAKPLLKGSKPATEKKENLTRNYKSFPKKQQTTKQVEEKRRTKIDRPVIFICNDPYVKGLRQLRSKAIVVYFNTLQTQRVVHRLKEITQFENIYIESQILTKICQMCNNDVRSSVGILELLVQLKAQLKLSAKQVMNRMRFSYIKDVNSSTNEFLSKVMQPLSKTNSQKDIFKTYQYQISQHDNPTLLSQTFFHNMLLNNHICLRMEAFTRLYRQIAHYDVMGRQNFIYHNEISQFAVFPYVYYRIHIRAEQHKKIEFPAIYFEKFNKHKANKSIVEKVLKGIPSNLIAFISNKSLVLQYLHLFWLTMQTSSVRQQDILRCVYKLLTYGIKLSARNSLNLFSPQIDVLLTFGINKPEINFSNSSRTLMEENYEFLKLKSQLVGDAFFDNNKQNLENVINQLKKNRRKKRDSQNGQVKYKYLEGTGTEVKYDLKIGYFFGK